MSGFEDRRRILEEILLDERAGAALHSCIERKKRTKNETGIYFSHIPNTGKSEDCLFFPGLHDIAEGGPSSVEPNTALPQEVEQNETYFSPVSIHTHPYMDVRLTQRRANPSPGDLRGSEDELRRIARLLSTKNIDKVMAERNYGVSLDPEKTKRIRRKEKLRTAIPLPLDMVAFCTPRKNWIILYQLNRIGSVGKNSHLERDELYTQLQNSGALRVVNLKYPAEWTHAKLRTATEYFAELPCPR